jgi:hypothetical protein
MIYRKLVGKDPSSTKKGGIHRKVGIMLTLSLLTLLVIACSQKEPEDKNRVAIQTVLEHDFNIFPKEDSIFE